jgi:hypothetical protein
MKIPITIKYNSGEEVTVVANPPEFARWEKETNKSTAKWGDDGYVGIWDLLFLSHSALKRTSDKPVRPFDAWIDIVEDCKVAIGGGENPKVIQKEA